MTEFIERRKEFIPVQHERRFEERLAVLEVRADNNDTRSADSQELLKKLVRRFDEHIIIESTNTQKLSTTLLQVTNTVDNLTTEIKRTNDALLDFAGKTEHTHEKVTRWDTMGKTIVKFAIVLATLISAGWAVYVHFNAPQSLQQGK
jgi:hypothetical protein